MSLFRAIVNSVAKAHEIAPCDLLGQSRMPKLAHPRQEAMYLVRTLSRCSWNRAGQLFNRDHTTIIHAVRKVQKWRGEDPDIDDRLERIENEMFLRFNPWRVREPIEVLRCADQDSSLAV